MLYKIIFGTKIAYDIQENYFRNILYTNTFHPIIKPFIAAYIRGKEYVSRLLVDHYFLAERQYENEFIFARKKSTVIENKYRPSDSLQDGPGFIRKTGEIQLIFTGTIAESTGIFECISLAQKLHHKEPSIHLNIVGYCAQSSIYNRLTRIIENLDFVHLHGARELVSHEEVLKAIEAADFGIIYYPTNKSTMNTMPTKLFEYLGTQLPILLQDHQPWVALAEQYDACIPISIHKLHPEKLLSEMKSRTFYKNLPGEEILWQSEERKLLQVVEKLLN